MVVVLQKENLLANKNKQLTQFFDLFLRKDSNPPIMSEKNRELADCNAYLIRLGRESSGRATDDGQAQKVDMV